MAWYDNLYSTVRIPDVIKALNALDGSGTTKQIEKKIIEINNLPKGMLKTKNEISLTKEPLELLVERGFIVLRGKRYIATEKKFREK